MYTIMIVEDDQALCAQLAEGIRKWRFNATMAKDFEHIGNDHLLRVDHHHCQPDVNHQYRSEQDGP